VKVKEKEKEQSVIGLIEGELGGGGGEPLPVSLILLIRMTPRAGRQVGDKIEWRPTNGIRNKRQELRQFTFPLQHLNCFSSKLELSFSRKSQLQKQSKAK
jgi:hypothetical protein